MIYDYLCTQCGHMHEKIVKRDEVDRVTCPVCYAPAKRQVSAGAFKFKGRVVKGGGPDRFTADMMGIPLKELPRDMRADAPLPY